MNEVVMDPHDLQLQKLGFTIDHLKSQLLKCADENAGRQYCTGNVVVSNICRDTVIAIDYLLKELEKEKKLNEEIKVRFVKCNTCTDEMKSKCLMFNESLCEGERCEELVDLMSLVNNSDDKRKIARGKEIIRLLLSNASGFTTDNWSEVAASAKQYLQEED